MNETIIGYHTLENRGNAEKIELDGPIAAKKLEKAWLGPGYYFWDRDVDWAHFWGMSLYGVRYYIFRAEIIFDAMCFDLHGNPEHKKILAEAIEEIKKKPHLIGNQKITLPKVIEYLKRHAELELDYDSARISHFPKDLKTLDVGGLRGEFIYLNDPIQICLFNLKRFDGEKFALYYE